jgi:hypothetical protein
MTSAASVIITGSASDDFIRSQHAVWASLPISLTNAHARAHLVAVDGQSASWLEALENAIGPDTTGVLVVRPVAGPPARDIRTVAAAASSAGTIVAVQTPWAANPAVPPFARSVARQLSDITLIDSVAQLDDDRRWADVLLDHLSLLRAVIGPVEMPRFAAQHRYGYTVDASIGAAVVAMSAVQSATAPQDTRLAAYCATAEAHLVVPSGSTATPAAAWFVDSVGASTQPTWYETPSRASWRRLNGAAERCGELLPDLTDLADDAELVAAITATWPEGAT